MNNKIKDFVNFKEKEVQYSFFLSVVIILLMHHLKIYDNFYAIQDMIIQIMETVLGGIIGLLGFSIGGIAIIVTLFSKEEIISIEEINGENVIEIFLNSYVFLSESIAFEVVCIIGILLCVISEEKLINETAFWAISWVLIYHLLFNIFYLVALVVNCVGLYKIKQIYGKLIKSEEVFKNNIDDVRIDFLLSTMMNICKCSQDEMAEYMIEFVNSEKLDNANKIENYIKSKYGSKRDE